MKYFFVSVLFILLNTNLTFASPQITEIMYYPESGGEWVEIYNPDDIDIDLKGWKLFDGVSHSITTTAVVPAGGYIILANDKNEFVSAFNSTIANVIDIVTGLNNDGDTVVLRNSSGEDISTVIYKADPAANKTGKSLQLVESEFLPWFPSIGEASSTTKQEILDNTPIDTSLNTVSADTKDVDTTSPYHAWPSDMNIFVYAGEDKVTLTGARVVFEGKALSSARKSLPNADMIWTFGDGGSDRGTSVGHTFHFPGKYIVILDVISGDYIAKDQVIVDVIAPKLKVVSDVVGEKGFIEIKNETKSTLDLGGYILSADGLYGTHFTIPKNTIILPGRTIIFPNQITKLFNHKSKVIILLPGGGEIVTEIEDNKIQESSQSTENKPVLYVENIRNEETNNITNIVPKTISNLAESFSNNIVKSVFLKNDHQSTETDEPFVGVTTEEEQEIATSTETPQVANILTTNQSSKNLLILGIIILSTIAFIITLMHFDRSQNKEKSILEEANEIEIIE